MSSLPSPLLGNGDEEKYPENLRLETELLADRKTVEIFPLLLNKKDAFTLKFFVTDYNGITIDARIAGVNSIKEVVSGESLPINRFISFVGVSVFTISLLSLVSSLIHLPPSLLITFVNVLSVLSGIAVPFIMLFCVYYPVKKITEKHD